MQISGQFCGRHAAPDYVRRPIGQRGVGVREGVDSRALAGRAGVGSSVAASPSFDSLWPHGQRDFGRLVWVAGGCTVAAARPLGHGTIGRPRHLFEKVEAELNMRPPSRWCHCFIQTTLCTRQHYYFSCLDAAWKKKKWVVDLFAAAQLNPAWQLNPWPDRNLDSVLEACSRIPNEVCIRARLPRFRRLSAVLGRTNPPPLPAQTPFPARHPHLVRPRPPRRSLQPPLVCIVSKRAREPSLPVSFSPPISGFRFEQTLPEHPR